MGEGVQSNKQTGHLVVGGCTKPAFLEMRAECRLSWFEYILPAPLVSVTMVAARKAVGAAFRFLFSTPPSFYFMQKRWLMSDTSHSNFRMELGSPRA